MVSDYCWEPLPLCRATGCLSSMPLQLRLVVHEGEMASGKDSGISLITGDCREAQLQQDCQRCRTLASHVSNVLNFIPLVRAFTSRSNIMPAVTVGIMKQSIINCLFSLLFHHDLFF